MARQTLQPALKEAMINTLATGLTPVIPVKSEAQLLMELELERLRKENESLRNRPQSRTTLKISEKGALSVYGMGRWPVTLYREQWERLIGMADEITAFIEANDSRLKTKDQD